MKSLDLKRVSLLTLIVFLIPFTSIFGATYTDRAAFDAAVVGPIITINFEGIATAGGQANAVNLVGDEFLGITLRQQALEPMVSLWGYQMKRSQVQ